MAGLPEYKIDRFGNVWGTLNPATGAAHIPCIVKWGDDERNMFTVEDEEDLICIVEAIAKEPGFHFRVTDVIDWMLKPVLNQMQVSANLRQSSIDERWNVW